MTSDLRYQPCRSSWVCPHGSHPPTPGYRAGAEADSTPDRRFPEEYRSSSAASFSLALRQLGCKTRVVETKVTKTCRQIYRVGRDVGHEGQDFQGTGAEPVGV